MEQLKKIILIVVIALWMAHPCFALSNAHEATTKKSSHLSTKKHSSLKKKKATVKKSVKKINKTTKKAKKVKKISRNRPNRVSSIAANQHAILLHASEMRASNTPGFVASIEQRLVEFVHNTVATLRYSVYKLGGQRFDTNRGVYILDCSSYVDRILEAVYPHAYSKLVNWTGSEKPTSYDYYNFFTSLDTKPQPFWTTVDDVEQLHPGDILVFRYKNSSGDETGGHVMIVMDKPIFDEDAFHVRVADSASSRHSEDTRVSNVSGIGIGTLQLKVNPKTYQPSAYAWRVGSRWKSNAYFAMARPIEKGVA